MLRTIGGAHDIAANRPRPFPKAPGMLNDQDRAIMITRDMSIAGNVRRVVHIIDGILTEGGGVEDA